MRTLANLYPWDIDGDPAAADRIAGLGLTGVTLAASYHAVRAVTPFHPRHRIVVRDAAVYYPPGRDTWRCSRLRPAEADPAGSFARAADALHAAGLPVTAWAVLTHNGRLGAASPGCTVENAYGDSYPWALCASVPAVRRYAATLAAEVAAQPGADAVELEACGWYGAGHGSAHDKTGLADPVLEWLLSLCFCPDCRDAYAAAGADPVRVLAAVRAAADERLTGTRGPLARAAGDAGLPAGVAAVVDTARAAVAGYFVREVIAAVRAAAPGKPVYLHADPDPRAAGANPGGDPAVLLGGDGADGIVLACWDPARAAGLVGRAAAAAPPGRTI
ncbi:MAG: hypothetical protein ACM32E_31950, partial [Gemmatimonadota bacterium]